tara:strand:+ start:416 stop:955 length:540 start_codon:yes stop_codon:yes gene_type:complete
MTDIRHIFGRSQKTIDEEKQKTIDEEDSEDEDAYEDFGMFAREYKKYFDSKYIVEDEEETIMIQIKSFIGSKDKKGEYSIKWFSNQGFYHLYGTKTNIDKTSYFSTDFCDLWTMQIEEEEEEEDCYTCDKCGCKTDETRYLPSIEDEKLESCCGEEYCMKCWDCGDLDKYKFIEEMTTE